jgi:hypothetical protein
MAIDRLKIYNGALLICKSRALGSLTENREPRYLLDQVWNDDGVRQCLQQGLWRFARRSAHLTYDTSITPDWGPKRAFQKPTDWVGTCAVCSDEYMKVPLVQYRDEVGYIFADLDDIYVTWVSDDVGYGLNLALWPTGFTEFVKAYFASKVCGKVSNDEALINRITLPKRGVLDRALLNAKNQDAQADPPKPLAQGSWSRARQGTGRAGGPFGDGGHTGSLIG